MVIREMWPRSFWTPLDHQDITAGTGHVNQCFCVGPRPGEKLCPCAMRAALSQAAYRNCTKPRIRVKAISVPA